MQRLQWQTKVENGDLISGPSCGQRHYDGGDIFSQGTKSYDNLRSVKNTMSRNFTPTLVYQRKRQINNSIPIFKIEPPNGVLKPCNRSQSVLSSEIPSSTARQNAVSISDPAAEISNVFNANDNCSERSSASLKLDVDDAGECSSSGALIDETEISARDLCVSILRSQGLRNKVRTAINRAPTENSEKYCSKTCGVCARTGSTSSMLICDNCEDGFHVSCYNPRIIVLPVGEWLCGSCSKKKRKILKHTSAGNSTNEIGRNRCLASEGELGSLESMFRDIEPYMSNVRIGDEFQADVPDWSGPVAEECNLGGDALELDPSGYVNIQERDSIKPVKLSSIGNWIQCRGVIEGTGEGVDGTICAKWRRGPLFEVQTDNWECFRCVLWDPAHADCAVPQEIETDEVMKQLKYIEMLRPRLVAKRRKTDNWKSNNCPVQDPPRRM